MSWPFLFLLTSVSFSCTHKLHTHPFVAFPGGSCTYHTPFPLSLPLLVSPYIQSRCTCLRHSSPRWCWHPLRSSPRRLENGSVSRNTLDSLCTFLTRSVYAYGGLPGMMSYGRLDPIIAPGAVSPHVHQISGSNGMQATYDYNTLRRESTCSNIIVQDDLSNYWVSGVKLDCAKYLALIAPHRHPQCTTTTAPATTR